MQFSLTFFRTMVYVALCLGGLGAVVLLGLLIKDWKEAKIW